MMFNSVRRPRDAPVTLIVAFAISLIVPWLSGCGDAGPSEPGPDEQLASELAGQLQSERREHRDDVVRYELQLADRQADQRAMTLIWAGTSAAAFILVLLLARERRARRVLERLLKLLLSRSTGSRSSP